ncbi:HPP family protein [Amycolatopsis sp. NPDC059657]|uniref:CBS domain-containing protein n=1 Tax=Amycolatopsis sp. NPDC059657 TaxID=3346899 RepID=UPI00366FFEAB
MRASEIMTSPAICTEPGTTVREAIVVLTEHGFAGLPVVGEDGQVVGVFTEFDALVGVRQADPDITVGNLMTSPVEVAEPDSDVAQIARRMLRDRLRCLPVVSDGRLVGVVSRRDLLRPLVRHDDAIASHVRALLSDYAAHQDRWSIEVGGGVVKVTGEFRDEAERRVVEALLRTVPGVAGIELSDLGRATT